MTVVKPHIKASLISLPPQTCLKKGDTTLKSTGIVRNVDELGRIVIPKEMRTKMNISSSDPIEIYVEDDRIILKKFENACSFCGSGLDLTAFKGKKVCAACIAEIKG